MLLAQIKDDVCKFAEVISKTLDVDVLIVDNNLKTISNTYRYFDKFTLINHTSVIGNVITCKQVVTIEDKKDFAVCVDCPDFSECTMSGFIGVPIFYNDVVVGAVALLLPKQRVSQIFKDIDNAVKFLESMVDLLASKLRNFDDYNTLSLITRERELLMDSVTDAIVSTDELGYITYYNKQFAKYFSLEKNCIGQMIQQVVPHEAIADFLKNPSEIKDKVISIITETASFNGFMSCNNTSIKRSLTIMLFLFKPLSLVSKELKRMGHSDNNISFPWADNRVFSWDTIDKAKRLSLSSDTILITGEDGTGKELLAKSIHSFSNRNDYILSIVYCDPLLRELQEQAIFGEFGKLHTSHKGSIYFKDVERLPLYLQKKLLEFIKKPVLHIQNTQPIAIDVKMVFSSSADLEKLVGEGRFNDELYYRISQNTICMPSLREKATLLEYAMESCIAFYKEKYGKHQLKFEKEALRALHRLKWPGNLRQLEAEVDHLVYHGKELITLTDLIHYNLVLHEQELAQPIREIEKEKITSLLKLHHNKGDMARILGMSRATLYRKIKKYELL